MAVTSAVETISSALAVGDLVGLEMALEGSRVRVEEVETEDSDGCRLRELGVYETAEIIVVSQGDPVVISIFGNRFAICRRCARHVRVSHLA